MADELPTPRSKSQIIGEMVAAFLSRQGIKGLRVGSPILTMIEAAAQSDLRSSADIFTIEEAISLDDAEGDALDNIGNTEDTPRIQEGRASTTVTITDTSFDKVQTKIYQGTAAPLAGSTTLNVASAANLTGGDRIYIGRGTSLYEGPILINSVTTFANYSTLNLASGTTRFHNLGESVIKAQGGDRTIQAGTVVQSTRSSLSDAVQFKLNYTVTVPDGENELAGVSVVALKPGTYGNVSADSITEFSSAPFAGATVTNALPVTNGVPREKDDDYRERIRSVRASRAKGTKLAIKLAALGVTAPDEPKRVLSSTVISRPGKASVLYIDDGSGYEEISEGVSVEPITDSAIGGEDTFQTAFRPITKAYLETENSAPFALTAGDKLAVNISGVVTEHTFDSDEFRSIDSASAYEVVASINSDIDLLWRARTAGGGTKVVIYAKDDENEDIQVQAPGTGDDANDILVFPSNRAYSISLYKNDRLLSKDGKLAILLSNSFDLWGALSGTETLILSIDGTPTQTVSITGQDFIDADTGYTTVGVNSLAAWATVLTNLIAGVTVEVAGSKLSVTSNKGRSSRASVNVTGGTLVSKGMFTSGVATGTTRDYVIDRNTGEIVTNKMLAVDDRLTIGSLATRAFVESDVLDIFTLSSDANLWFSVDGGAGIVTHGITSSTSVTVATSLHPNGFRVRLTATGCFENVRVNDWLILWDSALTDLYGRYRVAAVDGSGNWVEFEAPQLNAGRSGHRSTTSITSPNTVYNTGGFAGVVGTITKSAESYNLTTGVSTRLPPMSVDRCWHTATALNNGNLFVLGGYTNNSKTATGASEEFNGSSWVQQTTLPGGATIACHTATLLNDGNVLIVGGQNTSGTYLNTTYIYNTTTHTFSAGPTLTTARANHVAVKRGDGKVLIAGGEGTGPTQLASAELYDPAGPSFSAAGSMSVARHGSSGVLLNSGDVLVVGGCTTAFTFGTYTGTLSTATSEHNGAVWTAKTALTNGRAYGTASMLTGNSNKVTYLFGRHNGTKMGETFDPGGNTWTDVSAPGATLTSVIGSNTHIACDSATNNTSMWVIGGEDSTSHPKATVIKYTPSTDTWSVPNGMDGTVTLTHTGIAFVRSTDQTEHVVVTAGDYTASTLVTAIDITGATSKTYKTSKARVSTNTFAEDVGSIGLISADLSGQTLTIPTGVEDNLLGHVASVETANSVVGTPYFYNYTLRDMVYNDKVAVQNHTSDSYIPAAPYYLPNFTYVAAKPLDESTTNENVGLIGDTAFAGLVDSNTATDKISIDFNNGGVSVFESDPRPYDRAWFATPYSLTALDTLSVNIDGDATKKYSFNTWRKLKPNDTPYGSANTFVDADNGNSSLVDTLGVDYRYKDHALFMKARVQTHLQADAVHYTTPPADMTKAVLWRYYRLGPEGNLAQLRYTYPSAASQAITVTCDDIADVYNGINIVLGSGAARTAPTISNSHKVGYVSQGSGVATVFYGLKTSSATRSSGTVTVTIDPTFMTNTGITNVNITNGSLVYIKNNNVSFPDGYYTLTAVTGNTLSYAEGAGSLGATGISGSVSYGPSAATLAGTSIATGDYVNFGTATSLPSGFQGETMLISAYDDDLAFEGYIDEGLGGVATSITWVNLTDRTSVKFFQSNNDTAATIVSAVNALTPSIITGTLLGNGSGHINGSSASEGGAVAGQFLLKDGVNFIYSAAESGGNMQFTTKMTPYAGLATNSDWLNEDVRLVPVTATNVSDMLNSLAMTGLSSTATIQLSSKAKKVQIASNTAGSSGSVQIESGTANAASASVISSPVVTDGNRLAVTIATANADGFVGGGWVDIRNSNLLPRNIINSSTALTSITSAGVFTLSGTPIWTTAGGSSPTTSNLMQIETQGDFVCFQDTGLGTALSLTGVAEGDWVRIVTPATPVYPTAISSANTGMFRVVRVDTVTKAFWIENASVVVQAAAECDIHFFDIESMQVGDTIRISGSVWGADNNGVWTVTSVGDAGSGEYTNRYTFAVDISENTVTSTGSVAALGTNSPYVAVNEGTAGRFVKQIYTIYPNLDDATLTIIAFATTKAYNKISAAAGSVLTMRDKLAFPYTVSLGIDGYRHSTGLIGELNKVIEGDPEDPATYPGYKSEGARVNIEGAPIRRIQFSILIRGVNSTVVKNKIRSAVASVVNSKGVGQSFSFSEILGAVERIQGVTSATIISPEYDSSHDLVQVQPYERPFVLDLQNDIALSFFGE